MSEAYSVFWPQERWRCAAAAGQSLTVLFGGPHSSEPSFRRAAVQPGGLLYPIGVCDQVLYVFGRMRVQEVIALDGDDRQSRLSDYFAHYSEWRFLAPSCTSEVVIASGGTGIYFNRPVPGEVLQRLTYRPRRGPRLVKHVSEDGRLVHAVTVQGIYRLAEASAADFEAILTGPAGKLVPRPRRGRNQGPPLNMDPLF